MPNAKCQTPNTITQPPVSFAKVNLAREPASEPILWTIVLCLAFKGDRI
jgi:hypothetical protein